MPRRKKPTLPALSAAADRAKTYAELHEAYRTNLREAILTSKDGLWLLLTEVIFHPQIDCDEGACCAKKRNFYEPLHKMWCRWAQDDSKQYKGLLAPRGHFKSTVISLGKVIHAIVSDPNVRILLVSALEDNAVKFAGPVKAVFQNNPRFGWLFPEHHVESDKQFGPQHSFITPARTDFTLVAPTFTATYLDASHASQHYSLAIMDDPIEAKHVTTEEQAAKARRAYLKILPLMDRGAPILIVGTRWSHMDLYSTLITEELGGTATSTLYSWIVLSALMKDDAPNFDEGDPIFPTLWPRTALLEELEKAKVDPEQGEAFWWSQYMNRCRAPGQEPFLDAWFVQIPPAQVPPLFGKMVCIDTALKDDAKNLTAGDATVLIAGGFDAQGRLYIFPEWVYSKTMRSKEFRDSLVSLATRFNIVTVVKQKVGEDTLGTQIRDSFTEAHKPLDYRPIRLQSMGRKQIRIKDALQGPMARGEVFFVTRERANGKFEDNPVMLAAKKELINLGQYPNDDVADTLANFYHPDVKFNRRNVIGRGEWTVPHGAAPQLSRRGWQAHKPSQWSPRPH